MTPPCWTCSIYRFPPLCKQIWNNWRKTHATEFNALDLPLTLPKKWRDNPEICNNIIKACPFCNQDNYNVKKKGNLEHLHSYCTSRFLQETREHCYQRIKNALYDLYDYAAMKELNCSLQDTSRNTTLHENTLNAAKDAEIAERSVVRSSQLKKEKRSHNIAIKSRREIQILVMLHKIPPEKIEEHD